MSIRHFLRHLVSVRHFVRFLVDVQLREQLLRDPLALRLEHSGRRERHQESALTAAHQQLPAGVEGDLAPNPRKMTEEGGGGEQSTTSPSEVYVLHAFPPAFRHAPRWVAGLEGSP